MARMSNETYFIRKLLRLTTMNKNLLPKALQFLKPKEEKILRMRFGLFGDQPHTLQAIAETFGLTDSRIWQIEKEAIRKLLQSHDNIFTLIQDFRLERDRAIFG